MFYQELSLYIERIRCERGWSREDLIENIISLSQYKLYLKGINYGGAKMPLKVLIALSRRLGIKFEEILYDLDITKHGERQIIIETVNALSNLDLPSFNKLSKTINPNLIIDSDNLLLYHYVLILKNIVENNVYKERACLDLKNLIDYPKILQYQHITSSEFLVLGEILMLVAKDEQIHILRKMNAILANPKLVMSGDNEKLVLFLIVRVIKTLGINKEYHKAQHYINLGIKICLSKRLYYALDYLYYYASLYYYWVGDKNKYDYYIYKTYMAIHVDDNSSKESKFTKLLEETYQINLKEFISNYLKK